MRLEDFRPEVQARIRAQLAAEDQAREQAQASRLSMEAALTRASRKIAADLGEQVRAATGHDVRVEYDLSLMQSVTAGVLVEWDGTELRLRLPIRSWSLNAERAQHWREHRAWTKAAREQAVAALSGADLPGYVERVEIEATSFGFRGDPGADVGTVKACVDALVDLGVIKDDRGEFVRRLILNAPVPGGDPAVDIRVRPATA